MCRTAKSWRDLSGIGPTLLAALVCLSYYATILPVQGYLYRFPIVLFPLMFLFIWYCERRLVAEGIGGGIGPWKNPPAWAVKLATIFVVGWPLILFPIADAEVHARSEEDRVLVAQALEGIDGTMFVSEAGALPYYSKWRAYDWLGLVSEQIAHHGVGRDYLDAIAPDLIMHRTPLSQRNPAKRTTYTYMRDHRFAAVAAVVKTNYGDVEETMHHLYFVRTSSPLCREIVGRILSLRGVDFADLRKVGETEGYPIYLEGAEWRRLDASGPCTETSARSAN